MTRTCAWCAPGWALPCVRRTRSRSYRRWRAGSSRYRIDLATAGTGNESGGIGESALNSGPVARRKLRLIFGPSLVKEPVIYQLGRKFEIVTNIRRADVTKDHGWVLLEVSGEPDELDKGVDYLESRGVKVEPAEGDLVE